MGSPTDITSFVMFCGMFRDCHNLKIFNSVVKFIAIDVMDYFIGVKRAADPLQVIHLYPPELTQTEPAEAWILSRRP